MQIDGYSLEAQSNGLKRYADREEMLVIDTYEDAGKSGKSIEGRPAFKRMLNDISQGLEIDYILVYKLSRFGRNAADILSSLEYVQSYGVNLICIEEGIDSSMTAGRLLISVLSAVAEIERENIIEQTMNGRREKARQGGWNGGFAPYGYKLENNKLLIAEDEADVIRIIFDKFVNTDMGYNGVAKYLNLQGIKKKVRQNGTLTAWSSKTVKELIDNPVYCGKLAYGRRIREKVKGTKNEYKQVRTDNYILVDGEHEAIVSVEDWNKAKVKREATGIKAPSKVGRDRAHLLTGILKCPVCGSPMYTNKNAWTNKDGTYNERFYYVCSRRRQQRGVSCNYSAQLMKESIEPDVVLAIKQLVTNEEFAKEIKSRIGTEIDTTEIDREIKNYESNLRQVENNKRRLESDIDSLPEDSKYRDRKLQDMNRRLDNLYDTIYELEDKIEEAYAKRKSIEMSAITIDNVYKVLLNFDRVYDRLNDEEKKTMIQGFIKEIQIYPKEEQAKYKHPIRNITFNFPIIINGEEVDKISWENGNTVETCVLLSRKKLGGKSTKIEIEIDLSEADRRECIGTATYQEIKDYIWEHYQMKVSHLYIAQIKRKLGIIERENYNLPKNENEKVPNCPEEKERMIKEALEYFGMIKR
jgi:DNA invertase Pin-like site-specific DNA recombinase